MIDIKKNLEKVQQLSREAALKAGRNPEEIKLVVVTKNRSEKEIRILYSLGIRDFGENRVEQAEVKTDNLSDLDDINWHMIGHIQSRKARDVCELFDYVHSVDSKKLAGRLNRFAEEERISLPILLQINISGEDSKSGWRVESEGEMDILKYDIQTILSYKNIEVRGLMAMAPYDPIAENSRKHFKELSKLQELLRASFPKVEFNELSIGMSGDFEIAIEEGASLIRVGSAIFEH